MEAKILIIGHGKWPQGSAEGVEFITGVSEGIETYFIDEEHYIEELKAKVQAEFDAKIPLIIFCDIPGGSPHRTAVEMQIEQKRSDIAIFAGMGQSFIIDVAIKTALIKFSDINDFVTTLQQKFADTKTYTTLHGLN